MIKWFGSKNREDQPNFKKELARDSCNYVSYDAICRIDESFSVNRWKEADSVRDSLEDRFDPDSIDSPVAITDDKLISSYLTKIKPSNNWNFEKSGFIRSFTGVDKRYVFGAEFAVTALMACAAIAKFKHSASLNKKDKNNISKENFPGKIENNAYHSAMKVSESKEQLKAPQRLENYSGGFSGSLTDFMFGSNVQRPTFIIGTGDTLVSIAEALFQNSKLGYLIAQLNKDRTIQISKGDKLIVETNVRAVLKLPLGNDISEFLSADTKSLVPENLITIVKETTINKELLEEELKPIVAPAISWPSSSVNNAKFRNEKDKFKFGEFLKNDKKNHTKLKTIVLNGIKVNRSIDC